jgi:UDP-glucose 4-epimerase
VSNERQLRRVVVTGATGFIGGPLCAELAARGVEVVAAGRRRPISGSVEWVRVDLPKDVPERAFEGVDTVFHLAGRAHALGRSQDDAEAHDAVNREGTRAVARAAGAAGVGRLILMSSVKAMRAPGRERVREDDSGFPSDPYGLSKRLGEQEAVEAGARNDMEVVILRPALVYGPGVKGNLAHLLELIQAGRRLPLPRVDNRRSLVGLTDLLRCCFLSAQSRAAAGRTYVLTDGEVYSTERIIRALADAAGTDALPKARVPAPVLGMAARLGDRAERITGRQLPLNSAVLERLLGNAEYEARRAPIELGFTPSHSLEDVAAAMLTHVSGPAE